MATYYMHILNGRPAGFFDNRSVCFTNKRIPLAYSLRQIRQEQRISRQRDGEGGTFIYSYVTVNIPPKRLPPKRHSQ